MHQSQTVMWAVVAAYMIVITIAGSYYSKYMRTADAYFKAGNLIPWWAAGISMYMSNFTAYTFVAIASLVYIDGLAGLLLETGPALAFLIAAVVFARRWHRLNLTSPPEYLEARFNPQTRQVFSILGIGVTFIASGMRLYAMCKLGESILGVPLIWAIVVTGLVMIIYTMLGGLWAVIVTDVLQFVVLFLAVIPLFALSVSQIFIHGTWAEFVAKIPAGYAGFPHPEHGRTLGWLLIFWVAYLFDYNGDWGVIQRMCCTPSEKDARKAALLSMSFSIPHAFLLLGPVFIARVLWASEIADPSVVSQAESVYGKIATKLLPAGMIGVIAAAMFSATMSTLSVAWSVRSTSFVNDLYKRFLRPKAGDFEQILVGRIAVAAIGGIAIAVAILVALTSTGLFALAQDLIGLVVTPLILPLLLGLLVPRTHNWGGLIGLAACLGFTCLNRWGSHLIGLRAPLSFEYEIVVGLLVAVVAMLASGYLSRSPAWYRQSQEFLARMKAPRMVAAFDRSLPAPIGIIGTFILLIGALVLVLAFMPQTTLDRIVVVSASAVLVIIGITMRNRAKPLKL